MQGKGAIRFFAIALAVASLYSLSFTYFANRVENKALEYSNGDPTKYKAYLDSMQTETAYNLGVKKYTYQECKALSLNLGLDLKGGMNVTMEITLGELVKSLSGNNPDATFNKALEMATEKQKTSQKDFITLFGESFSEIDKNAKLAAIFATQANKNSVKFDATNEEVIKFLKIEAESAVNRSFNILRSRIDKFGVTQPNIQLQAGTNRVLIELPGVDDAARVRKLLQGTASLEFWEAYDNRFTYKYFEQFNKVIAAKQAINKGKKDTTVTVANDSTVTDSTKKESLALLDKIGTGKDSTKNPADTTADAKLQKTRSENPLFAIAQIPLFQNEQGQQMVAPGPIVAYVQLKDTAKLAGYLRMAEVRAITPSSLRFLWSAKPRKDSKNVFELYAIKLSGRGGQAPLDGTAISDARSDVGQDGSSEVIMYMKPEGAQIWKRMTAQAAGDPSTKEDNQAIAIVLDNTVQSAPTVQNEIAGGVSNITGNFTSDETKDLSNLLKSGKLPAPARIIEEAIVGPSLGQEAINAGLLSAIVGLIVVLLFMIFYYNSSGLIADIALFANLFFMMGVLASLGAVLTLPGIAGIVLTIGTSVDANVLIYERIREELAEGKSMKLAIADGFRLAMPSILDANITLFLTGLIMALLGSGPILGFATTLIIGIVTSLFAAIFITRLIFEARLALGKEIKFSNPLTKNLFKDSKFDFLKRRRLFYFISTAIIVAGIASIAVKGFNLGVDFKGGRTYVIRFKENVSTEKVRESLKAKFEAAPEVKTFGSFNQVKITTDYLIENNDEVSDRTVETKLKEGLSSFGANTSEIMSSQKIGPTIANDIKTSAFWSIFLSLAVVFVYIVLRFRRWQFGMGAMVATGHDVLILIAIFSIFDGILPFSLSIDQQFIAAALTVMGYSMNDTVVVFDRVREYLNGAKKGEALGSIINNALNSTLSRTLVTGLSTIMVLIILFIFGGEVIRGFSFAMLIGVIFGTYSSIFVATPIVVDFIRTKEDKI